MVDIGQLCVKIAGRDAGKECLIIEDMDGSFVKVDGLTRRKRCNINHLEILPKKADIKKGASHEDVLEALRSLGIKVKEIKRAKKDKSKKSSKKSKKTKKKKSKKKKSKK